MADTLTTRQTTHSGHLCGHPSCPGAAAGYARLLAAHTPARPLLTADGEEFLRDLLRSTGGTDTFDPPAPRWDSGSRCLWLGNRLLKAFRQPAPYQTTLLAAFEEGGWTAGYVDDPLSPE